MKPYFARHRFYLLKEFLKTFFLNLTFSLLWADKICYHHVNKAKVYFQTLVNMCCIKTYSKLSPILNFNGNALLTFLFTSLIEFSNFYDIWIDFKAQRFSANANSKRIIWTYVILPYNIWRIHKTLLVRTNIFVSM